MREIQREIHDYYAADASKYGEERKLMIRRIYDLIPSNMENKKKRVVAKSIEDKKGKTFRDYSDEFEYLISAGIALPVQAISNPGFPADRVRREKPAQALSQRCGAPDVPSLREQYPRRPG